MKKTKKKVNRPVEKLKLQILQLEQQVDVINSIRRSLDILSSLTREIHDQTRPKYNFGRDMAMNNLRLAHELKKAGHTTWDLDNLIDHFNRQLTPYR